jgi:hypothetical protein
MTRVFQIAVLSCLAFWLTGCHGSKQKEPIWEQVKITDLAPFPGDKQPNDQLLKTINFKVYFFEIPAENISTLDDIWPILYAQPLQFNDYDAFVANSFLAGYGQIPMWNKAAELLRAADGIQANTISLLLPDGQSNDIAVAGLVREQTVFYISKKGAMEGAALGPGRFGLRIKAEKIPGSRGVCKMSVMPVFSPPRRRSIPLLTTREKSGEFTFSSVGFSLRMGPGDFVLLGPDKYDNSLITLGSLLFSKPEGSLFFGRLEHKAPERKPAIRLLLLVCTGMNY